MKIISTIIAKAKRHCLIVLIAVFAVSCSQRESRLQAVKTDEGIEIMDGDSKVLFYQMKPKSLDGKFERANYIHPLYSLKGTVITEDFPEDHLHHHGIFFAWHQIVCNDSSIADGWMSENLSWNVVDATASNDGNVITISSEVMWNSSLDGQRQEPIAQEKSKIAVYESSERFRIIDYDFNLKPLLDSLGIGGSDDEKGYGGFSLRLKLPDDIKFVAKEGPVEAQVLPVEAGPWMNFTGSFDGPMAPACGVVVFCHPSNPGSPQPWILRKEKSMQNPAFPGRVPVALNRNALNLRYRMVIHSGGLDARAIEALYQEYVKL